MARGHCVPLLVGLSLVLACAKPPTPQPGEDDRLRRFFEQSFDQRLRRSPELQTHLGIKDDYGLWDDRSDVRAVEEQALATAELEALVEQFEPDQLSPESRLSYELFRFEKERQIEGFPWRFHTYPVNQMFGIQAGIPAFLINFHRIDSEADARAYIQRLRGVRTVLRQVEANLEQRARMGILPPLFVFPYVLQDSHNVLSGFPFEITEQESTLYADFRTKVEALDLPEATQTELLSEAQAALIESVGPAYRHLIEVVSRIQASATTDDGVWKLPDGDDFYNYRLVEMTTTNLDAREIHTIGLAEVARIHDEMREIMAAVGFQGDLQQFFSFLREDDRFYDPDTPEGRAAYLARANEFVAEMQEHLSDAFKTLPKAGLKVKAVEPFREKSAGKAFYSRPAPDGSRPGIVYVNLYSMRDMPIFEAESLAYHEGVPGHHMQLAISAELEDLPRFRRFGGPTAFIEGWGLYSEYLAKEMGAYEDPYQDFGRLSLELWRACRLVVDTGIHWLRWTREQAIEYLLANTAVSRDGARKAIERYIVMPGQATAYKVGMLRILEIRERARQNLGDEFDIRDFHEEILRNGAVPLPILEANIDRWVAARPSSKTNR
ncbi:DUF885 domain-containing protein [Myxococcota bacterium]|nr:DUF885 domain-containing protein [Myxococcota bacterium]